MPQTQIEKAELFRAQHHAEKILLLPNIWDTLSAKLISTLGYPSLATASVSMSLVNGYADGENMPYKVLIEKVKLIVESVDLPVTVDIERGYAESINQLKDNIKLLIDSGAVGLNIEDGLDHGKVILPINEQCRRIEAIRETAIISNVPIVINARTDLFMKPQKGDELKLAVERANAYEAAGADCFYPILINNYDDISRLLEQIKIPVNVVLMPLIGDLKKLEIIGVKRVSVGPALLKLALSSIKNAAEELLNYNPKEFFDPRQISYEVMNNLV